MGVTPAQRSWLTACEPRRLQPVGEPETKMKFFLVSSKVTGIPSFSKILLRRCHPHRALPIEGKGSLASTDLTPQEQSSSELRDTTLALGNAAAADVRLKVWSPPSARLFRAPGIAASLLFW